MEPLVIYTLSGCPYCARALGLLATKGRPWQEIDVTGDWEERGRVCARSGHRTFPQIFLGSAFLGGCDEIHALDRDGRLDALLA